MRTRAPVCARLTAKLRVVVVFPSAGTQEVTTRTFGACPAEESSTEVRKCRNASASGERLSMSSSSAGFPCPFPWPFPFPFPFDVLNCRNFPVLEPSSRLRRALLFSDGTVASVGSRSRRLTSSVDRTPSSRYSNSVARQTPKPRENMKAKSIPCNRLGPIGARGGIA